MIHLISTPEYVDPANANVICRWLATESPNNFRLQRRDWQVGTPVNVGGHLQVTCTTDYTGHAGNSIAVYDLATGSMKVGEIVSVSVGLRDIITDIPFVTGINPTYLNDDTLHAGYYFEGQLTINDVTHPLTIVASPDSFGYADLDVSGILRIVTALGKAGNYTLPLVRETNKSGKFQFEYRECWYASLTTSPPMYELEPNIWYYAECVRSEEQGSNLHDYVANVLNDAPFLNMFTQPIYFEGYPFDISFILDKLPLVSPSSEIIITLNRYNSVGVLLGSKQTIIDASSFDGSIASLNFDSVTVPSGTGTFGEYILPEIEVL
jgi:hypothetical protein